MQADLGKNYFELFGLPVAFEVDLADLASRYRELQRRFHPDRFASSPETDRRLSLQVTAQINAAYRTLRDDVARGRYLLGLQGVDTGEETDTKMDPAFLMEQMELREDLDDARAATDRQARLEKLRTSVESMLAMKTAALGVLLKKDTGEAHRHARNLVREMQFLQKLANEIDELE
jgi:molecular chaperone HscB